MARDSLEEEGAVVMTTHEETRKDPCPIEVWDSGDGLEAVKMSSGDVVVDSMDVEIAHLIVVGIRFPGTCCPGLAGEAGEASGLGEAMSSITGRGIERYGLIVAELDRVCASQHWDTDRAMALRRFPRV
jgi:hypothetical protein